MRRLPLISADYSQLELRVMAALIESERKGPSLKLVVDSIGDLYMPPFKRKKKVTRAKPIAELAEEAKPGYVVNGQRPVTVEAQIVEVRPLAIKLVQPDLMDYPYYAWLPRSLIVAPSKSGHFTSRTQLTKIVIPAWLAIDKKLVFTEGNTVVDEQYILPGEGGSLDDRLKKVAREMKEKGITIDTETDPRFRSPVQHPSEIDHSTHTHPGGECERCPSCFQFWSRDCKECEQRLAKDKTPEAVPAQTPIEAKPNPFPHGDLSLAPAGTKPCPHGGWALQCYQCCMVAQGKSIPPKFECGPGIAGLPLKPKREHFTVDVTDEDLLCVDTREG